MTLRSRAVAAGTLAALMLSPLASPANAGPGDFSQCGEAGFTSPGPVSGSHYGVQKVQAKGTTCRKALKVAKAVEQQGGKSYTKLKFTCTPKALRGDGRRPYKCVKTTRSGKAIITFTSVGAG